MATRKKLSASVRWSVFARDGFTCRYCGARGGQDGVELHADHLVSVADGGDNSIPNLLTACQKCNGGKGAKSLTESPDAVGVADRMKERAKSLKQQAAILRKSMEAERQIQQEAVNLKCAAYQTKETRMQPGEQTTIINLCKEFGAETVTGWYRIAFGRRISEWRAVQYVCGIARNVRKEAEDKDA
jgi:hypothetical protein